MTALLDFHLAGADELAAAHANVHDIWGQGLPLAQHVERRLTSLLHRHATWVVGTLGGEVVVSLGSHPIHFRLDGRVVPGIGIGSVYTRRDQRGRGFAPQLIRWVEAYEAARGARLSLLYSDIGNAYYARLGYQAGPSHWSLGTVAGHGIPGTVQLIPFEPRAHLAEMDRLFRAQFGRLPLAIDRPPGYWQHLVDRGPDNDFFWIETSSGKRIGYARTRVHKGALQLRDWACEQSNPETLQDVAATLARMAADRALSGLSGWFPALPALRQVLRIEPRTEELAMLKPLGPGIELSSAALAAVDQFLEIDHV